MIVSEAVKGLRRQRGWTQRTLATELGVSPGAVANWEQGTREPEPDIAAKMAGFCDGEPSDVLAQQAGIAHLAPHYSRSFLTLSTELAQAHSLALRGVKMLTDRAAQGDARALTELKHYAEEIMKRAGHATSLPASAEKPKGEARLPRRQEKR